MCLRFRPRCAEQRTLAGVMRDHAVHAVASAARAMRALIASPRGRQAFLRGGDSFANAPGAVPRPHRAGRRGIQDSAHRRSRRQNSGDISAAFREEARRRFSGALALANNLAIISCAWRNGAPLRPDSARPQWPLRGPKRPRACALRWARAATAPAATVSMATAWSVRANRAPCLPASRRW